jgi:hypothetical protein
MSMSRTKVASAMCVAVMALLAASAASASAAGWHVNGAALGSGSSEELAKATTTVTAFQLHLLNNQITLTCTGIQNDKAAIVGTKSFKAKSLSLTGCTSSAVNCPVEPTVTTTEVKGEVTSGTPDTIRIEPTAGPAKLIMIVVFTGPLCALEGEFPVKGNFTVSSELGSEQSEHQLAVTSSELSSGSGNTDSLSGAADFKLAGGGSWSFR